MPQRARHACDIMAIDLAIEINNSADSAHAPPIPVLLPNAVLTVPELLLPVNFSQGARRESWISRQHHITTHLR